MSDRAAAVAIPPSGVRRCRLPVRGKSRRPCAPSGLDSLAHPRYARRPAARQHLLPDAGIGDAELSCAPLGRWPYSQLVRMPANSQSAGMWNIRYRSLRHDVVCAYHLAPAPGFVLNEGRRFGRRSAVRLDIERAEALLHIGHLENPDGGLGDLILQFRLELGRSDHRIPDARKKVGKPNLGAGRHIRHRRGARLVGHRQDLELAIEIKSERPRYVAEEDIDALP